ncbi:MAG: hypothetical protein WA908_02990 [Pontixanthobacter sp.]
MTRFRKIAASACVLASVTMTATPGMAVELPVTTAMYVAPISVTSDAPLLWDAETVDVNHRRYRHRHYRGRYDRGRYYRHRNRGVDAGDVIAGVLILGGIAAVVDAASKGDRDRDYRNAPDYRDRRGRYDNQSGLDRAIDICRSAVDRDARVENIDSVNRTRTGWSVTGTLFDGEGFTCRLNNNGAVDGISYGDGFAPVQDNQGDDAQYRSAWANVGPGDGYAQTAYVANTDLNATDDGPMPDYPGGPIDGDIPYADQPVSDDTFGG